MSAFPHVRVEPCENGGTKALEKESDLNGLVTKENMNNCVAPAETMQLSCIPASYPRLPKFRTEKSRTTVSHSIQQSTSQNSLLPKTFVSCSSEPSPLDRLKPETQGAIASSNRPALTSKPPIPCALAGNVGPFKLSQRISKETMLPLQTPGAATMLASTSNPGALSPVGDSPCLLSVSGFQRPNSDNINSTPVIGQSKGSSFSSLSPSSRHHLTQRCAKNTAIGVNDSRRDVDCSSQINKNDNSGDSSEDSLFPHNATKSNFLSSSIKVVPLKVLSQNGTPVGSTSYSPLTSSMLNFNISSNAPTPKNSCPSLPSSSLILSLDHIVQKDSGREGADHSEDKFISHKGSKLQFTSAKLPTVSQNQHQKLHREKTSSFDECSPPLFPKMHLVPRSTGKANINSDNQTFMSFTDKRTFLMPSFTSVSGTNLFSSEKETIMSGTDAVSQTTLTNEHRKSARKSSTFNRSNSFSCELSFSRESFASDFSSQCSHENGYDDHRRHWVGPYGAEKPQIPSNISFASNCSSSLCVINQEVGVSRGDGNPDSNNYSSSSLEPHSSRAGYCRQRSTQSSGPVLGSWCPEDLEKFRTGHQQEKPESGSNHLSLIRSHIKPSKSRSVLNPSPDCDALKSIIHADEIANAAKLDDPLTDDESDNESGFFLLHMPSSKPEAKAPVITPNIELESRSSYYSNPLVEAYSTDNDNSRSHGYEDTWKRLMASLTKSDSSLHQCDRTNNGTPDDVFSPPRPDLGTNSAGPSEMLLDKTPCHVVSSLSTFQVATPPETFDSRTSMKRQSTYDIASLDICDDSVFPSHERSPKFPRIHKLSVNQKNNSQR